MVKVYPDANVITTSETIEIAVTTLKIKIYVDANVIATSETILTGWGLDWSLSKIWLGEVETAANCSAIAFVTQYSTVNIVSATDTSCESLAIWPEPPAPTATASCAGKDLHKQVLRLGNSHQISLAIECEETTSVAVGLLQIIFELTQPGNDVSVFKKTRFGAPGGIILDLIQDKSQGKILLLVDLQLRPNQIAFSGSQSEFDFIVAVENKAINQRAEVATGTLILSKE